MDSNRETEPLRFAGDALDTSTSTTRIPAGGSDTDGAATGIRWSIWIRIGDICGVALWTFALSKLLIDFDRIVAERVGGPADWLVDYRILFVIPALMAIALFMWRRATIFLVAYSLLFPLIVVLWKVPAFVVRRRSWLLAMIAINMVALAIRNLRYNIVSKGATALAILVLILFDSRYTAAPAAVTLIATLGWSFGRTLGDTFRPNWFLNLQRAAIQRVVDSSYLRSVTFATTDLSDLQGDSNDQSVATAATNLSIAICVNRAVYMWAYRLSQYRQSQLAFLFNMSTYIGLLIRAIITSIFVNVAVYQVDGSQFSPPRSSSVS
jgi:hypothetical protein